MKQAEHLTGKANFDIRKRAINGKLFQNQKVIRDQFVLNTKKALGKKYMQDHNIFKLKQDEPKKQHRQIVMSEQFIKSSKLYRLLRQKTDRCDSLFIKQANSISDHKTKLKDEIVGIKSQNYKQKVSLWQLKNKLMQLKIILHQEEEQSKRLAQQNYAEYQQEEQQQAQNQMQMQQQTQEQNQQEKQNGQSLERSHQQDQNQHRQNQNYNGYKKQTQALEFNKNSMVENGWKNDELDKDSAYLRKKIQYLNKQSACSNKNSVEQNEWKNLQQDKSSTQQKGLKSLQTVQSKVQFRDILQQLLSLKAERHILQEQKQPSLYQTPPQKNSSCQEEDKSGTQVGQFAQECHSGGLDIQEDALMEQVRQQIQSKTQPAYQVTDRLHYNN